MTAEAVKCVVQKMAERDNGQDATERDEGVACPEANQDKGAGNEFNERNGDADRP